MGGVGRITQVGDAARHQEPSPSRGAAALEQVVFVSIASGSGARGDVELAIEEPSSSYFTLYYPEECSGPRTGARNWGGWRRRD